jgi:hypothetical protein
MSIAAVIHEIDAYLLVLRRARSVLTAPFSEARPARPAKRKKVVRDRKKPNLPTTEKIPNRKLRSSQSVTESNLEGPGPSPSVPSSLTHQPSDTKPPLRPTTEAVPAVVEGGDGLRPASTTPSKKRVNSTGARSAISRKLRVPSTKPAIALAGPMNAKIVVVSAAQAQREREEATRPSPQKTRVPTSGLSGRRAFEALFADLSDPPKNSRQ